MESKIYKAQFIMAPVRYTNFYYCSSSLLKQQTIAILKTNNQLFANNNGQQSNIKVSKNALSGLIDICLDVRLDSYLNR